MIAEQMKKLTPQKLIFKMDLNFHHQGLTKFKSQILQGLHFSFLQQRNL